MGRKHQTWLQQSSSPLYMKSPPPTRLPLTRPKKSSSRQLTRIFPCFMVGFHGSSIYEGSINIRQLFLLPNVRVTNITIMDPHWLFNLTLGGEQVTKPNHRMEKRSSRSLGVWLGPWWEWLSQITWDNGLNPHSPSSISKKYLQMFSFSAVLLFNLFKL